MYPRSKYWYISIALFIILPINLDAQDICNNTQNEQIISDGENEQYIPPQMCVTVSEDSSEIITKEEEVVIKTEPIEVEQTTSSVEVDVSEEEQVNKEVIENTEIEMVESDEVKEVENKKYYIIVIPTILFVLIALIRKFRI